MNGVGETRLIFRLDTETENQFNNAIFQSSECSTNLETSKDRVINLNQSDLRYPDQPRSEIKLSREAFLWNLIAMTVLYTCLQLSSLIL